MNPNQNPWVRFPEILRREPPNAGLVFRKDEEHSNELKKITGEKMERDERIMEQSKMIEVLKDELETAKEAAERAPSKTLKQSCGKTSKPASLSKKSTKSQLSQALLQLRARYGINSRGKRSRLIARRAEGASQCAARLWTKRDNWVVKAIFQKRPCACCNVGRELKELETATRTAGGKKDQELRIEKNKGSERKKPAEIEMLQKELEKAASEMHGAIGLIRGAQVKSLSGEGWAASIRTTGSIATAVELGRTAEDLIMAEEENVVSVPRRLPHAADSDSEVTKAVNKRLEGEVEKSEQQIEKFKTNMKKIESENKVRECISYTPDQGVPLIKPSIVRRHPQACLQGRTTFTCERHRKSVT
ncbi:centrosomal protein of 290 kDa-like [Acropora muricata]|uniref:centrosomal protein of 290 kDa-like n=1 Tax=Acropora muricata TaxID=159855 RepID=UPI0034E37F7D